MEGTLRSAADFSRVMRKGKIVTTPDAVIHMLPTNDGAPGRYGMVVSTKNRGAVQRNRARRQIREAIRLSGGFGDGVDGVVLLRRGRRVNVSALSGEICQIAARSNGAQ